MFEDLDVEVFLDLDLNPIEFQCLEFLKFL